MSYQSPYVRQTNKMLGWSPRQVRRYWNERAQMCSEFADEGECLAQVAKHEPVTIAGLGASPYTPRRRRVPYESIQPEYVPVGPRGRPLNGLGAVEAGDITEALEVAAQIVKDPNAVLKARGPAIVSALDRHVVEPTLENVAKTLAPYLLKYALPPIAILYLLTGMSTFYSYKTYKSYVGS